MMERCLPSAVVRRWRVPGGRFSSTLRRILLYSTSAEGDLALSIRFGLRMQALPGRCDRLAKVKRKDDRFLAFERRGRHRERAQPGAEKSRYAGRIAASIAAQAHVAARLAPVPHDVR